MPDNKYRIEFTSPSYKIGYDINGLSFRGVNITPTPAYEQLVQVFIDRAPLHMPDKYFFSSLSPFGRVVHVQDLRVRGFQNIRTGTRMVTMSVLKPIPTQLQIANFVCSVRYKGQPPFCLVCKAFGHLARNCPQGRSKTSATRKVPAKPADSQQRTRPMEVSISVPPKSFAQVTADHPEHPGASVIEAAVDPSQHAVPPIIMETESVCTVVSPTAAPEPSALAPSVEQSSATATHTTSEQLVVEINEFKEIVSFSEDFSCRRHVTVVHKRASSKEKTKRLQKTRSSVGAKKSSRLSAVSPASSPTSAASPHHLPLPAVSEHVPPVSTTVPSRDIGKMRSTKLIRERRLQQSRCKSSASVRKLSKDQQFAAKSSAKHDSLAPAQPVVDTSNRFALLRDEVDDLVSLAGTVIDPLASPSPSRSSYEPRGSAGTSVSQTPKCDTPSAFLPDPDLDDPHQPVAEFSPPPEPSRQPLDPSTALVPLGYAFHDDGGSVLAPSVVDGVSQQRVSSQVLPLAASQTGYTSSAPSSLPPLRLCDQLFPELPALLALSPWSGHSEGPLSTPSCHFGSALSPASSSGASFYARSLDPSFQEGGSDRDPFSDGDDPPSLLPSVPASAVQSVVLAGQAAGYPSALVSVHHTSSDV